MSIFVYCIGKCYKYQVEGSPSLVWLAYGYELAIKPFPLT